MSGTSDQFNWDDVADSVVQQSAERVAIYSNPHGDIVIRQERRWDEDEDVFIVIARGHAIRTAYGILKAGGLDDINFYRQKEGGLCQDVPIRSRHDDCTPRHQLEGRQRDLQSDRSRCL
jgi:hypothetical protein